MKIGYTEICTGTNTVLDCTKSRQEFALRAAKEYCKQHKKRCSLRTIEYFETDAGSYHKVRDILEGIQTKDFAEVVQKFAELYPTFHKDWQSALETGLVIKAGNREGNYNNTPYIYNCALAARIREAGLNFMEPIIEEILNERKEIVA